VKQAIAIRHVHFEDLGLLAEVLSAAGYQVTYREAAVDHLDPRELMAADLLIILGGPIGVYEDDVYTFLTDEIAAVRDRLAAERPVLGLCLGAQIMARALGCRVFPSGVKEVGWAPVSLTEAGRRSVLAPLGRLAVLHWHGDTFDLPEGAALLASTEAVTNQAFTLGRHGLALQFHLEAQPAGLERWYIGHAGEIASLPEVDVPLLRRQAAAAAPALAGAARKVFADWLAALPVPQ
jgi:GMP synthase (glutamine-hydrolysing)